VQITSYCVKWFGQLLVLKPQLSATVCAVIEGNLAQDVVVTITTQSITAQGVFCMYKNTYVTLYTVGGC